ncbi:hypothetical protein SAMN05444487_10521 [Marininema mesophilum]|uniref:Uncharacterized protein n=1 Tax=Marininema mesophilum TaxID=1048340 RepID=A0A1H2V878_9BACL|nr:hypothetical protein [Marininema mesophilum]SDW64485.1 hypothetical protein SAMN05444487_10521 [Marininema mesophilum]
MKTWIKDTEMNAIAMGKNIITTIACNLQGARLSAWTFSAVVLLSQVAAVIVVAVTKGCINLAFHGVRMSRFGIPASIFSWLDPFPDPSSASP